MNTVANFLLILEGRQPLPDVTLYFQHGTSDKVYRAYIVPSSGGKYAVNFSYGRRGATLNNGTKTPQAMKLADAMLIHQRLIAAKEARGYEVGASYDSGDDAPVQPKDCSTELQRLIAKFGADAVRSAIG